MAHASAEPRTTPDTLTDEQIASYRDRGFVKIEGIISQDEVARYYDIALAVHKRRGGEHRDVFSQDVNIWVDHDDIRPLTLHPNIGGIAQKLAGVALRIWHDHLLIKWPKHSTPTEFHQDQPYWCHDHSVEPISCWLALCDVPVERGCMTFIPGSKERTDLTPQNLQDPESLFGMAPDLRYAERVTLPLKAGDCTFHHGRCAHSANANATDDPRVAHVMIFMDECTTFSGKDHVVTKSLGLGVGAKLDGELFPTVDDIIAGRVQCREGLDDAP
jgi:phytanoyl-CoA hydroxylase